MRSRSLFAPPRHAQRPLPDSTCPVSAHSPRRHSWCWLGFFCEGSKLRSSLSNVRSRHCLDRKRRARTSMAGVSWPYGNAASRACLSCHSRSRRSSWSRPHSLAGPPSVVLGRGQWDCFQFDGVQVPFKRLGGWHVGELWSCFEVESLLFFSFAFCSFIQSCWWGSGNLKQPTGTPEYFQPTHRNQWEDAFADLRNL